MPKKIEKIVLWGAGDRTRQMLRYGYFPSAEVIGIIDTYQRRESYEGIRVYEPGKLKELLREADYVVVSNESSCEINGLCRKLGIPMEQVMFTEFLDQGCVTNDMEQIRELSPKLYADMQLRRRRLMLMNEGDAFDQRRLTGKGAYGREEYMKDYYRYRTFEYMAEEIEEGKVEGAAAEFGVFRGTFASLINEKFSRRKLYLFDTFEGFVEEEAKREEEKGRCPEGFASEHERTSEEVLLERLPNPERCVICKGRFPESIPEEAGKERYAFVSLDVDFEESTLEGLRFFYPRLSEGGAIFLHDYHSAFLGGVKEAVRRYEKEQGSRLRKAPLADRAGTLVILK